MLSLSFSILVSVSLVYLLFRLPLSYQSEEGCVSGSSFPRFFPSFCYVEGFSFFFLRMCLFEPDSLWASRPTSKLNASLFLFCAWYALFVDSSLRNRRLSFALYRFSFLHPFQSRSFVFRLEFCELGCRFVTDTLLRNILALFLFFSLALQAALREGSDN